MGENLVTYIMMAVLFVPMLLAGIRLLGHRFAPDPSFPVSRGHASSDRIFLPVRACFFATLTCSS